MEKEIKIELVNSSHYAEIVDLEEFLWASTHEYREHMFYWKYVNTPFPEKCIGAVAVCDNKVVGFRGLIQTEWRYNALTTNTVFTTDAVVHPDYRGLKIMAKLTTFILENIKDRYDYLLVLSPNVRSGSVYKSIGTKFFTSFVYYKKQCAIVLGKRDAVVLNSIDDIWECRESFEEKSSNCLDAVITKEYYQWKMQEPEKEFRFITDKDHSAYALLEIRSKNVEIFDFGYRNSLRDVLKLVESYAHKIGKLYVNFPLYYNQEKEYKNVIENGGYHKYLWLKKIKKSFSPIKSIMIRPIEIDNPDKQNIGDLKHDSPSSWNFKHLLYV